MRSPSHLVAPSNILLVEPDPRQQSELRRTLGRNGRTFWSAGSRAEALALGKRSPCPDIAIVAANLPDGSGIELIADLRKVAAPCQCITITARPTIKSATRAMQLGAIDYLIKPFDDLRALANSVEWALARASEERRLLQLEERLEQNEERYALALEATQDGLWDWDLRTNRLYLSARWKQILSCEDGGDSASPDDWFCRVHPDDRENLKQILASQASKGGTRFEIDYRMRSEGGGYVWVRTRGVAIKDKSDGAVRMAGTLSDISRSKAIERRLMHEALHDGLTHLFNRVAFQQRLIAAFSQNRSADKRGNFAVLFLDLDRFKNINDSLGHQAGDELLVEISRRLQGSIRADDCLARLGGDEFAILLQDVHDMNDVGPILRRIEEDIRAPCQVRGYQVVPSVSIGIAFGWGNCKGPEEILRNADLAMYRAKKEGRSRVEIFEEDMHASILDSFRLEEELRSAVVSDSLTVHYQPIFELSSRRLKGFEALVRWKHPERGWISPDLFIPVAEDCGLVLALGKSVLTAACHQLASWHARGYPSLTMSINLSPCQVFDPDIVATIGDAIAESGVAPGAVRLEITEGVFIGKMEMASFILEQLKALQVGISLDDFGTGYSSLSYLSRLPFDMLKIDRSFVLALEDDGSSLVEAIVTMAHALDIDVTAEGIENKAQMAALMELGCDLGQGFLLARPLEATAAGQLLPRANSSVRDLSVARPLPSAQLE